MSGRLPLRCFQSMVIQLWANQVSTPDYCLVDGGKFNWLSSGVGSISRNSPHLFGTNNKPNTKWVTIKTLIIPFPLNPDGFKFRDPYFMAYNPYNWVHQIVVEVTPSSAWVPRHSLHCVFESLCQNLAARNLGLTFTRNQNGRNWNLFHIQIYTYMLWQQ